MHIEELFTFHIQHFKKLDIPQFSLRGKRMKNRKKEEKMKRAIRNEKRNFALFVEKRSQHKSERRNKSLNLY
jgi:hypothetical protein